MKLPGYIKFERIERGEDGANVVFSIRRWHPSFWIEVAKEALRRIRVVTIRIGRTDG